MRTACKYRIAAAAVGVVGLLAASPSGAATQIGATFAPTAICMDQATWIQSPSGAGSGYATPFRGVITAWRYQAGNDPPDSLKLKVARPVAGNEFTFVGESRGKAPAASTLNTYADILIPVRAGDVIGLHVSADLTGAQCGLFPAPGYAAHGRTGDFPPGTTEDMGGSLDGFQLDISATLEPDIDCDGLGDETQDPSITPPGDCPEPAPEPAPEPTARINRTLTLDANKAKVKEGKSVRLTGQLDASGNETPCESGQTVALQRKKPSQATFVTFAQVQTDSQGSFSLKKKVKKTFEFRAQVVETAACTAALSNSEKVKVKKKRKG